MNPTTPRPGQPVRGSATGRPIMALFDLLGRTWAMGVIWQLGDGAQTFRGLQQCCDQVSASLLNRRLKELRDVHLVRRGESGYELTELGGELHCLLKPMGKWSLDWEAHLASEPSKLGSI